MHKDSFLQSSRWQESLHFSPWVKSWEPKTISATFHLLCLFWQYIYILLTSFVCFLNTPGKERFLKVPASGGESETSDTFLKIYVVRCQHTLNTLSLVRLKTQTRFKVYLTKFNKPLKTFWKSNLDKSSLTWGSDQTSTTHPAVMDPLNHLGF